MLFKIFTEGLKKGAYLIVESWENDGDNYATKMRHFDSVQTAEFELEILRAQTPLMNYYYEGGACLRESEEWEHSIKNLQELVSNGKFNDCPQFKELETLINEASQGDTDGLCDLLWDSGYKLMGGSDCYYLRVLEKAMILEVLEDKALGVVASQFTSR
ncbi:MAG: hypothetical protein ACRCTW_12050 [Lactococcus garvieae]